MATIIDYCKWRGDLSFEERPLNEVDALVLTFLSYLYIEKATIDFDGLTVSETIDNLLSNEWLIKSADAHLNSEVHHELLQLIAQSPRFGQLHIIDSTSHLVHEETVQFSATIFKLTSHHHFLSFRGTDDSIVGWKEDFMMSFTKIPSQDEALSYIKNQLQPNISYTVGGHSKGGNLALYACSHLTENERNQIEKIYVIDGPGLSEDVFNVSVLDTILDKTYALLPESSVIGRLFEPAYLHKKIVLSTDKGLNQHGTLNWQINTNQVVEIPSHDSSSDWIAENLSTWLVSIPNNEREYMIEDLFKKLTVGNSLSLFDIADKGLSGIEEILVGLIGTKGTTKRLSGKFFLTTLFGNQDWQNWDMIKKQLRSLPMLMIGTGILLLLISNALMNSLVTCFFFILLSIQGYQVYQRLQKNHWNLKAERIRIRIFLILLSILVVILFKENALEFVSNITVGIAFLFLAFQLSTKLGKRSQQSLLIFMIKCLEIFLYAVLGMFLLFAPYYTVSAAMFSLGIILIIDGCFQLLRTAYIN